MIWLRLAPVTAELMLVSAMVFASCLIESGMSVQRFADVQRDLWAIHTLESVERIDGVSGLNELTLSGPFDVWTGEWWRIPLTVFHHESLLHLVLGMGAISYLGTRLERHWGSLRMTLFLLPSACVPVIAELFYGQSFMGLTGVACAILGVLVVLRNSNKEVAISFPVEAAEIGMAIILICWLATIIDVFRFPNAAHLTGFLYGGLFASVQQYWQKHGWRPVIQRAFVFLMHLWLIPAGLVICHPFWLGRYHWFTAVKAETVLRTELCYQQAIRCDPSLTGVWLRWSHLAESQGNLLLAWDRLIRGLAANPSSLLLIEGAQRVWRHLDMDQRSGAESILMQVFGGQGSAWLNQIRTGASVLEFKYNEDVSKDVGEAELNRFRLDQKIDLEFQNSLPAQPKSQVLEIPFGKNDAMEGKSL